MHKEYFKTFRGYLLRGVGYFTALALLSFPKSGFCDSSINVGISTSLSGNGARYGEWGQRGITLAVKHVNDAGGLRGRPLVAIFEDNALIPSQAVTNYQKLRNINGIDYLLATSSSIALALSPIVNRDKVVLIDYTSTTPSYSSPDDFTFRTGPIGTQFAKALSETMAKQFAVTRAGVLYIENDFGVSLSDAFKKNFSGEIPVMESFRAADGDYRLQLMRLVRAKVDHVLLAGHLVDSGMILRQARELGISAQFYSTVYSIEGPEFLEVAGEAAEGVIYFSPRFDTSRPDSVAARFAKAYEASYGEQANYFSAQAYDALLALYHAMLRCELVSASCVKDKLYEVNFEGASGQIKFDRYGDVEKTLEAKVVRSGKFLLYE